MTPKKVGMFYIGCLILVFLSSYFVYNYALKNDEHEIKETLLAYDTNVPIYNIIHIEFLRNHEAIAFYELSNNVFGKALMKNTILGWRVTLTVNMVDRNQFRFQTQSIIWSSLPLHFFSPRNKKTYLFGGEIIDLEIKEVLVRTTENIEYKGNIIDGIRGQRFWFLIIEDSNVRYSKVLGLSKDGDLLYKE